MRRRLCLATVCLILHLKLSFLQNFKSLYDRNIFYDRKGVGYVVSVSNSFSGDITFSSSVMIDFHSVHYIDSITLKIKPNQTGVSEKDLNVCIRGDSPHGSRIIQCPETSSIDALTVTFVCTGISRYLNILTKRPVEVALWSFKGHITFTELFYGCFEHNEDTSSYPRVRDLRDCLGFCSRSNNTYAGVKISNCICLKQAGHLRPTGLKNCVDLFDKDLIGQMVGSGNILPLYLTDFQDLENQKEPSVDCIMDVGKCAACKPGFKGIPCIRRDCNNDNGACGKHKCVSFVDNMVEGSVCHCDKGWLAHYIKNCKDIDECLDPSSCNKTLSTCANTPGSYNCTCLGGFKSVTPVTCEDIDECQTDTDNCERSSTDCQNTWSSFACACKKGFENLKKSSCTDIDECLKTPCDEKTSKCRNIVGSYYCKCTIGFRRMTDFLCNDVDECMGSDLCDTGSTNCLNLLGSYKCICKSGFERTDKYSCKDIDECELAMHTCDKLSHCTNTDGSYICGCGPGFLQQTFSYITVCEDIDECKLNHNCNLVKSVCVNYRGGFTCPCRMGYKRADNYTCKVAETVNFTTEREDFYIYTSDFAPVGFEINLARAGTYALFPLFAILMAMVMVVVKLNSMSWRRSSDSYDESESTLDDDYD